MKVKDCIAHVKFFDDIDMTITANNLSDEKKLKIFTDYINDEYNPELTVNEGIVSYLSIEYIYETNYKEQ